MFVHIIQETITLYSSVPNTKPEKQVNLIGALLDKKQADEKVAYLNEHAVLSVEGDVRYTVKSLPVGANPSWLVDIKE